MAKNTKVTGEIRQYVIDHSDESLSDIAKKFEIKRDTLYATVRRNNIPFKKDPNRFKKGQRPYHYKGWIMKSGYVRIFANNHSKCNICGYVKLHRLIVEEAIGYIPTDFIHHIDANRFNNIITNLLMVNRHLHLKLHSLKLMFPDLYKLKCEELWHKQFVAEKVRDIDFRNILWKKYGLPLDSQLEM